MSFIEKVTTIVKITRKISHILPKGRITMDAQKKQVLKAALSQIDKQFRKGSVMFLGDAKSNTDIEAVSTGSLTLDIARWYWRDYPVGV